MSTDTGWVVVKEVQGLPEAYIIKGKLEANGIPCVLEYESMGIVTGINVNYLGRVKIKVGEPDRQEASLLCEPE